MMTKMSQRDRLIAILLPGLLLLIAYLYAYSPTQKKELKDLQNRIEKAKDALPMPTKTAALKGDATSAEAALIAARAGLAQLRAKVADTAPRWLDAARRAQATDGLAREFRRQGLLVLKEGPSADAGTVVRQALLQLRNEFGMKSALSASPPDSGQPWEIKFVGDFPKTLQVLAILRTAEDPILPLSLTMQPPSPGNTARVWTLTVWK